MSTTDPVSRYEFLLLKNRVAELELEVANLTLDLTLRDIEAKIAEGAARETPYDRAAVHTRRINRDIDRAVLDALSRNRRLRRRRARTVR